jgi:hypothetical protein
MCSRARIVAPGQTGTDPDGAEIPIFGGDVTLDANAEVRGTIELETSSEYWPTSDTDLATPYGNELFVERGIVLGSGSRVLVSQGYYRLDDVEQTEIPGHIRLSGSDRMTHVKDSILLAPVQFGAATSLSTVVEQLVLEVLPDATFDMDTDFATATLGRSVIAEADRYAFLLDAVRSHGKIWYWDHTGALRISTPPDPAAPVYTVKSGQGGVLVELRQKLSREGMYNAVVVTGEAPDTNAPVRAVAYDNNPTSPTYWHGSFGRVPRPYSSPFITTTAQAASAAASLLRRALGLPRQVDFQTVPNPALEPEDPVRLVSPQETRTHVLERITLPLANTDTAQSANTRQRVADQIAFEEG